MAGHGKTLFLPEVSPYSGECIAEGGAAFVIPGRAHNGPACLRAELCGEQGHEGEQPEQARGRACDGQVGPLALGLNAQMRPGLLERGLQLPTLNEPAQDLVRVLVGVGAEQGLRAELAKRVTHQYPPDRHDGQSSMAPDRGAGAQVNGALAPAIPARHQGVLPDRARIDKHLGQVPQPLALGPRTSDCSGQTGRCRIIEGGIKAQAGDADDTVADKSGQESRAAKLLSATSTRSRPGSHLRACRTTCLPHSVSFLCRRPCSRLYRSEGASAVRNGRAQMRSAQGIGTSSIALSQRRPDALTKCPWLERTGSR